jgi:hypothetical protein
MKKPVTLALVLLLSACAQIPAPTTAANTAPAANKMCGSCSCCQKMHHGSAMQGGMMMPDAGTKQSCQMCARMQQGKAASPTPSANQTNDHLQHHSRNH